MESAISNATALITGNKGGYVYIKHNKDGQPEEIYIMDTNDINTATKMWRWNKNGFGYSDDGGETFGLAMTMDGNIVADFIHGGTIDGVEIRSKGFARRWAKDYTEADYTRLYEIMNGRIEPTEEDYEKYDFDNSRSLDALDMIVCYKLVNNQIEYYDIDTTMTISATNSKDILKATGVSIGANYVYGYNMFVNRWLSLEDFGRIRVKASGEGSIDGYKYGEDGVFTNITSIEVIGGVVTKVNGTRTDL